MLEEILRHLNNWFVRETSAGVWHVKDGSISLPFLASGQYFMIEGSVFNDGLHQYPETDLKDETFKGTISALAVPKAVEDISVEIEEWVSKNPDSQYTSESFGGYSYSKATGASGAPVSWQGVFRSRLNKWRKIRC